jgi:hypothetical protein
MHACATIATTALLCFAALPTAAAGVPAAASEAIAKVHAAAAAKDLEALRALMDADEFTSSFGGDGGVDEALKLWREDPALLAELARVTAQRCALDEGYVECPAKAGTGYRAGFKLTAQGWRMQWFLAGD